MTFTRPTGSILILDGVADSTLTDFPSNSNHAIGSGFIARTNAESSMLLLEKSSLADSLEGFLAI
jgi:hypothetical protein